jgi:hypothetical protein
LFVEIRKQAGGAWRTSPTGRFGKYVPDSNRAKGLRRSPTRPR